MSLCEEADFANADQPVFSCLSKKLDAIKDPKCQAAVKGQMSCEASVAAGRPAKCEQGEPVRKCLHKADASELSKECSESEFSFVSTFISAFSSLLPPTYSHPFSFPFKIGQWSSVTCVLVICVLNWCSTAGRIIFDVVGGRY